MIIESIRCLETFFPNSILAVKSVREHICLQKIFTFPASDRACQRLPERNVELFV
jgi:hypothetical protein